MTPFRLSSQVAAAVREPHHMPRAPVPEAPSAGLSNGGAPVAGVGDAAHAVPWRVVRRSARGVIELEQLGREPLRAVRVSLAGDGMLGLTLPRTVYPGERLRVVLRGAGGRDTSAAPDAMLVLRWFQPDGTELLWPIAL